MEWSCVTVNNVAPTVFLSGDTIDENGIATVDGIIIDPGTLDVINVTLAWGDGSSESFTMPEGAIAFTRTHQYLADNPTGTSSDNITVTATATDDDSGSGTGTAIVNVRNVNPVVDAGTFQTTVIQEEIDRFGLKKLSSEGIHRIGVRPGKLVVTLTLMDNFNFAECGGSEIDFIAIGGSGITIDGGRFIVDRARTINPSPQSARPGGLV